MKKGKRWTEERTTILDHVRKKVEQVENYDQILSYCNTCLCIYINPKKEGVPKLLRKLSEEEKNILTETVESLNKIYPPPESDYLLGKGFKDFTGGICKSCLAISQGGKIIRRKQLEEGCFDCFGRGLGFCDQEGMCCYHNLCVISYEENNVWKERIERLKIAGIYLNAFPLR